MEEQRQDYPDILNRLASIEKKVNGGLADQFKDLKDDNKRIWDKHDVEAKEFRCRTENTWIRVEDKTDKGMASINLKIDGLINVLNNRPCVVHSEEIKNLKGIFGVQLLVGLALIATVVASLISYGRLDRQVDVNTQRWEHLIDEGKVK